MQQLQLQYKSSIINYYLGGQGKTTVICFHGYGENAKGYFFLEKLAGNDFQFLSLDLPYHGETVWKEKSPISGNDFVEIINQILRASNSKENPIILLGFSLGGRVALSCYSLLAGRVSKLVLLAPDGLKVNAWYWLATQTTLGKGLFSFTMKKPGWFFGLLKGMNSLRLVNTSVYKFVSYYIGNKEARIELFHRWIGLAKIKPDLQRIKVLINNNNTNVKLLYGKHDRIILSSVGERFRKGIEKHCTVLLIDSGHQVLHEKHAGPIIEALLH